MGPCTAALARDQQVRARTRTTNIFNPAALALVVTCYIFNTGQSWWGALPGVPLVHPASACAGILRALMRRSHMHIVLWASAVYLLITVAMTWPLILHAGSVVPNDLGDPLLNIWLMGWNASVTPLTAAWWNGGMFYPAPGAMAFSEHLLGLAVITSPVIWLTGNAVLAYNAGFLLSFPLCALAAYTLAYILVRRHDAAFLAGLAFAFAPYRIAQLPHVQVESAYWMPLALAGLHLFQRDRRARWLVLFAASWVMQALACGYYLFFLSVLVGFWLAWFAIGRMRWMDLARVGLAWVAGAAVLSPVLYGYWGVHRAYGLRRWPLEIQGYSADVASVLKAPSLLRFWGWLDVFDRAESEIFPGLTIVVLILTALVLAWRATHRERVSTPRLAVVLLTLACTAIAVALSLAVVGPWKLSIGGVRLLSVSRAHKPLTFAVLLLIGAAAFHPAVRVAWRRRSTLAFYSLAAGAMWLFSLGPTPTLMGARFMYKAPYAWLMLLPGVDGVRVPARFWMLAVLCLAMAAAVALRHLVERRPRLAPMLPVIACAGILLDGWPRAIPLLAPPASRPVSTDAVARLELPLETWHDIAALYRSVENRRLLINGYSGYFPPHYSMLRFLLDRRDPAVLTSLSSLGAIEVVVNHEFDQDRTLRAFVGAYSGARVVQESADYTLYRIEGGPSMPARPVFMGEPLQIEGFTATVRPEATMLMVDGNLLTRWGSERPQAPGDCVTADLGAARQVAGLEVILAGYATDFPRGLRIDTSADGSTWTEGRSGPVAVEAMWAALDEPRTIPLRLVFAPRAARYVRLTQTETEPVYYWSIAELRVYGG